MFYPNNSNCGRLDSSERVPISVKIHDPSEKRHTCVLAMAMEVMGIHMKDGVEENLDIITRIQYGYFHITS